MREAVIKLLKEALKEEKIKITAPEIDNLIEIPPNADMGDYAFPCFFLAERLKQGPHEIALNIRENIGEPTATDFDDIQVKGSYINFFLDRKNMARKVVWEAITYKQKFGQGKIGKDKKVVVEFSSPNIAKPFGIGHLRSTIIGNSIANICEFQGFKVIRLNYPGDWGTQFGRILHGYEKYGNEKKLQKDPMKHLLEIYVKAGRSKNCEEKSREWFKKMEDGDRKALMTWKLFRDFSIKDFKRIYKIFGIKFDSIEGESVYNKKMGKVIEELKTKKLLRKSEGAYVVSLKKYNLGVVLIQKTDGATLYATRDITAAIDRYRRYKFNTMIYEVGQEQKLYFRQLFKVLELMGYEWAKNCVHVDHGFYLDKDGKKFATRKGKTVLLEDILEETVKLAKKQIKKKTPKIKGDDLEERALKMAIAAIFYGDMKNNRLSNVNFDLNKFVSFEGDTGPYIQYSYARATSILKKSKTREKFKVPELKPKEIELVKKLSLFPEVVSKAYESLNPSLIANYSYQLAQVFNEFYHSCKVVGSEQEMFRSALVEAFRQVLKNSLGLLGIPVLEEM